MRNLFRNLKQGASNILQHQETMKSDHGVTGKDTSKDAARDAELGVGDIEEVGEFGLGIAPHTAKPVHKIELSKEREAEIEMMNQYFEKEDKNEEHIQQQEEIAMIQRMRLRNRNQERRKPIDRQAAFIEYKNAEEGKEIEQSIMTCRADLLERRMEMKSSTDQCNGLKN